MGQLEEMNASLAAIKASLKAIERQNAATRVDELAAVVVKQNADLRAAMVKQHAELRQDVIKQNADNAVLMLKQTAALIAAVQEQTKAIEKLAAPGRESGKRKRVEGTSADAGNEQETSATDSQTSAAEKLVSSSLKGKGPADAGEGTSTARRKKKMKAPAPAPAPAKEVVSVNATGPHEGTCTWTIPNFSKLKVDGKGKKFSDVFSICGHKWKLRVYPRGCGSGKDKSVSVFLELADDTNEWPEDRKVTVASTFSVICQHDPDKSHKEEGDEPDIYSAKENSWGFGNLISLTDFHDAARGFLVNDTVIFEAEIEVKEVVSVNATGPLEGMCTWTIPNFSKLEVDEDGGKFSDTFSIGGHEWDLEVYPRGEGYGKDKSVSLFLHLADDTDKLPKDRKVTVASNFSVICQYNPEKSHTKEGDEPYSYSAEDDFFPWGYSNLISLTDFHDAANGFLVNDTVTFEAKIEVKKPSKTKRRRTRSTTSRT